MRALRNVCWLMAGFFFAFAAGCAFADTTFPNGTAAKTTAAYQQCQKSWNGVAEGTCGTVSNGEALAYCQSKDSRMTRTRGTLTTYTWNGDCQGEAGTPPITYTSAPFNLTMKGSCSAAGPYTLTLPYNSCTSHCPAGYTDIGGSCYAACPANSMRSSDGTTCVCNAGYVADGQGACVPSNCPAKGSNAMTGGAVAWKISGTSSSCQSTGFGGCEMTCSSGVSANGTAACTGCTWTGDVSATSAEPVSAGTTEADCTAQGKGFATINGVTTCAEATTATESKTTTTTDAAGNVTGGTTVTNTYNAETNTTTTTTTTTNSYGGSTGGSTATESGSAFCRDNPTAAVCKEAVGDPSDPCTTSPDRIGCAEFGEVADPGAIPTEAAIVPTSLSPVAVSQNMSCPADVPLPKGLTFSWAGACEFASGVYWAVIAVAWLTAGLILFGGVKES